jgi:hypothetical protein
LSDRLYVATRKGLFTLDRRANEWQITDTAFLGAPVIHVLPDRRDGWVYAALKHGHFGPKFHRRCPGGADWEEAAVCDYPEPPPDAEEIRCAIRNIPIPWKLDMMWVLAAGGEDEEGVLWCGTLPGGLFKSADRGSSWQLVRSLWDRPERRFWSGGGYDYPGIHSICVDPRAARSVTVAVSSGGVWATSDGGETWECRSSGMRCEYMPPEQAGDPNVQDPHRMVQCRANPDALWAQHHNGIFRTVDGGRQWVEITTARPSGFGFAAAVHPADPDTAWFVPAVKDECRIPADGRVVVSRTRDGGNTFDVFGEGLPERHAYDITYRHGLDVDESGERLAFGSTTGSLWLSENQGERWTQVSGHLPPINAVCFASSARA